MMRKRTFNAAQFVRENALAVGIAVLVIIASVWMILANGNGSLPQNPPPLGGSRNTAGMAYGTVAISNLPGWTSELKNTKMEPEDALRGSNIKVTVNAPDGTEQNDFYAYSKMHVYDKNSRSWKELAANEQSGTIAGSWRKGKAVFSFNVDQSFTPKNNYFITYWCIRSGSSWNCNSNKWGLGMFDVREADDPVTPFPITPSDGERLNSVPVKNDFLNLKTAKMKALGDDCAKKFDEKISSDFKFDTGGIANGANAPLSEISSQPENIFLDGAPGLNFWSTAYKYSTGSDVYLLAKALSHADNFADRLYKAQSLGQLYTGLHGRDPPSWVEAYLLLSKVDVVKELIDGNYDISNDNFKHTERVKDILTRVTEYNRQKNEPNLALAKKVWNTAKTRWDSKIKELLESERDKFHDHLPNVFVNHIAVMLKAYSLYQDQSFLDEADSSLKKFEEHFLLDGGGIRYAPDQTPSQAYTQDVILQLADVYVSAGRIGSNNRIAAGIAQRTKNIIKEREQYYLEQSSPYGLMEAYSAIGPKTDDWFSLGGHGDAAALVGRLTGNSGVLHMANVLKGWNANIYYAMMAKTMYDEADEPAPPASPSEEYKNSAYRNDNIFGASGSFDVSGFNFNFGFSGSAARPTIAGAAISSKKLACINRDKGISVHYPLDSALRIAAIGAGDYYGSFKGAYHGRSVLEQPDWITEDPAGMIVMEDISSFSASYLPRQSRYNNIGPANADYKVQQLMAGTKQGIVLLMKIDKTKGSFGDDAPASALIRLGPKEGKWKDFIDGRLSVIGTDATGLPLSTGHKSASSGKIFLKEGSVLNVNHLRASIAKTNFGSISASQDKKDFQNYDNHIDVLFAGTGKDSYYILSVLQPVYEADIDVKELNVDGSIISFMYSVDGYKIRAFMPSEAPPAVPGWPTLIGGIIPDQYMAALKPECWSFGVGMEQKRVIDTPGKQAECSRYRQAVIDYKIDNKDAISARINAITTKKTTFTIPIPKDEKEKTKCYLAGSKIEDSHTELNTLDAPVYLGIGQHVLCVTAPSVPPNDA